MSTLVSHIRKPPAILSIWFAFTTVIVIWDAGYCFNRPRSMPGGDLAWIWKPYNMVPYSMIDHVYGLPALNRNDGFTNAQALMNLFEVMLNIEYLYLRHFSSRTSKLQPGQKEHHYHGHAPLVGFATSVMTTAKTQLYFWQDYFGGWSMTGHNTRRRFWLYYVAPNSIWIIAPAIVAIILGRFIAEALNRQFASEVAYEEFIHHSPQTALKNDTAVAKENGTDEKSTGSSTGFVKGTGGVARRTRSRNQLKEQPEAGPSNLPPSQPVSTTSNSSYPTPHPGAALPITLTPVNRVCLVIGHNRLAASRIFSLLEAEAKVVVVSEKKQEELHDELQYRISSRQIIYHQISFISSEEWKEFMFDHKVTLACVTDTLISPSTRPFLSAQNISIAARNLRIPINISDNPSLSDFNFPSTHRFPGLAGIPSSLQASVSTNGNGCRLNSRIKRDIISRLPKDIGSAVDNVGQLRLIAKSRSKSRSRSIENGGVGISEDDTETPLNEPVQQLDTPGLLSSASDRLSHLPEEGGDAGGNNDVEQATDKVRRMKWVYQMSEYYSYDQLSRLTLGDMEKALETWNDQNNKPPPKGILTQHQLLLSGTQTPLSKDIIKPKGKIYLVGSGPGHPGLLTQAAHTILKTATIILSDKLVPAEILSLIPSTTKLHIAKKFPGNNEGAQNEMMELALQAANAGETVVRLKQGDPFVYGRGGEEVLYFRKNGFESILIPGISSVLAGPLMCGIPVTQRGVAESMILCTGVGRNGKSVNLPGYIKSRTLVLLMGVARIKQIIEVLTLEKAEGRDGEMFPKYLPIAVIERASSPDQRVISSTLEHIEEALKSVEERPPGMIVVGWSVLALAGEGRVDILDKEIMIGGQQNEKEIVSKWMGGDGGNGKWEIKEGLSPGFHDCAF